MSAVRDLPLDIRLMQGTTRALLWLFALGVLVAAGNWLAQRNWWDIRAVQLRGDLRRISPLTVRAEALPRLDGNFLTINLGAAQHVFEQLPWVRDAVVQRLWPMQLVVTITPQHPRAYWTDDTGQPQLLNTRGQPFVANLAEVQGMDLPRFSGPSGSAPQVLQTAEVLAPVLAAGQHKISDLTLGDDGNWRLQTDDGLRLDLGQEPTADGTLARLRQFLVLAPQLSGRYGRAVVSVDLRYPNGFAVHLKGAASPDAGSQSKKAARAR